MSEQTGKTGVFRCGMPYNQFGRGPRILVIFQGLMFENKPMSGFMLKKFGEMYRSLEDDYTIYIVTRKPGLPQGYTMRDIGNDYADMIREEFGGAVDALGVSTGGSIVQHFAADHPESVRRLIIHSSAYVLSDAAREGQMRVAVLARQKKWRAAYAALMGVSLPKGLLRYLLKPLFAIVSLFGGAFFGRPENPMDLVVTIEAEDKHNFEDRLAQIAAPTLVIAGDKDPFYTPELFRKTADGIPNARLILYEGMGHPASGKQFQSDIYTFLTRPD
jgi:pimeloyl-ACP methyl ester carboxylesterase